MTENTKKISILTKVIGLIAALVVGIVTFIVTFVCASDKETGMRFLTALCALFVGGFFTIAIYFLVLAIMKRDRFSGVIAYAAAALGLVCLLMLLVAWYFVLMAAVLAFLAFWMVSLALYSKKLTLVADNEKPGYKTYEQRKAEEAAKAEEQAKTEEKEELPEIKSFKD